MLAVQGIPAQPVLTHCRNTHVDSVYFQNQTNTAGNPYAGIEPT